MKYIQMKLFLSLTPVGKAILIYETEKGIKKLWDEVMYLPSQAKLFCRFYMQCYYNDHQNMLNYRKLIIRTVLCPIVGFSRTL